jgi:26S proteasome regulatory subunit N5
MILAKIKEGEGKVAEAATILQEVQVETFGSMKKKEKTNFILEQMRLCLAKKDYIRAQIMSRKINPKVLDDKEFQEERIKYYTYMVDYYFHEHSYLNIYRSYQSIYTTPSVQESPDQKNDVRCFHIAYLEESHYNLTNRQ